MYFFIDTQDQSIGTFKTLGNAARAAVLKITGQEVQEGQDPVKTANTVLNDRGLIVNISGAFEAIEHSEGIAAQELAASFKHSVNDYFKR